MRLQFLQGTVRTYKTRYDVGRVHVLVSNFLGYVSTKNYQNRMKSDKDVTKIKRVTFYLRQSKVTVSSLLNLFCTVSTVVLSASARWSVCVVQNCRAQLGLSRKKAAYWN